MPAVLTGKSQTEHTVGRSYFCPSPLSKAIFVELVRGLNKVKRLKNLLLLLLFSFSAYVIKLNPVIVDNDSDDRSSHLLSVCNVPGPVLVP